MCPNEVSRAFTLSPDVAKLLALNILFPLRNQEAYRENNSGNDRQEGIIKLWEAWHGTVETTGFCRIYKRRDNPHESIRKAMSEARRQTDRTINGNALEKFDNYTNRDCD